MAQSEESVPGESVYHVELRQFPHNMCRFNISAGELRANILEPWAQERWVEFGERKWSPHQATLTVLRGPRIPFGQLTMGRGWRTAQRSGTDVTEELLAEVRAAAGSSASEGSPGDAIRDTSAGARLVDDLAADSLGLELLAQLGSEPAMLRRAWELAAERNPGSPASATLALAERGVESLLRAGLVALVGEGTQALGGEEATRVVSLVASWGTAGTAGAVLIRKV
ncbi:MAG TPA: hypothetical protein VGI76_08355 [Solirubrobacteraceae bacterium]|jgi:hypothetical protein